MTKKQTTKATPAGTPRKAPKTPAKGAAKARTRSAPKPDAAVPATRRESNPRTTPTTATPKTAATKTRDPRLPAAGAILTRNYKGREIRVTVLESAFRHEGKEFRSLTALALAITGYPAISGPAWFGLATPKRSAAKGKKIAADATTEETVAAPVADAQSANHAE